MLSSGAICMLLLHRWDQRLLSPSGTNQQTTGNTLGIVYSVQRTGRSCTQVRHNSARTAHGWQHMGSSECLAETAALAEQCGMQRAMLSKLYQTAYVVHSLGYLRQKH